MGEPNNEMDINQMSDEKTESDNVTAIELQRTKRILHFSDGTIEEFDSDGEDTSPDIVDKCMEMNIDLKTLPIMPRIKYQAYQVGCKFLNGIDYVGGGLANFLGITTPKFVSESDINAVYQEQLHDECGEENNATWKQDNNNTSNTVITRYPHNVVTVHK